MKPLVCCYSFQHVLELTAQAAKACSLRAPPTPFTICPPGLLGSSAAPSSALTPLSLYPASPFPHRGALRHSPGCPHLPSPPLPEFPVSLRPAIYLFPSLSTPVPSPVPRYPPPKVLSSFCRALQVGLVAPRPLAFLPACYCPPGLEVQPWMPLFPSSSSGSHRPSYHGHVSFKFIFSNPLVFFLKKPQKLC